jgi:hypothetical protein
MKKKFYLALIIMAAFATLNGCKKGDTGPAGTNGTNGTNGNVNVLSKPFSLTSSSWGNLIGTFGTAGCYFKTDIADADITQDVVNKGAVLVYYDNKQLPFTENYPAYTRSYTDSISISSVQIRVGDSDGNSQNPGTVSGHIIIIPSSNRPANPPATYTEAKKMYNLND